MKNTYKFLIVAVSLLLAVALLFSLVACNKQVVEEEDKHFAADKLFAIDDETAVVGLPFSTFSEVFDESECYFTFTSSGKVHGQIKTKSKNEIFEVLGSLLGLLNVDLDTIGAGLAEIDLDETIVEPYVLDMFPGFTLDHVVESFELMTKSLGLSLVGFDLENEAIKGIIEEIEATHRVPADLIDRLPDDFSFGLAFDGTYFLKTVVDADGHSRQAIYVGGAVAHNPATQPFVIFSVEESGGKMHLKLDVEFIMISFELCEIA